MNPNMAETLETLIDDVQDEDYGLDVDQADLDLSLLRLNSFGNSSDHRRRRANSSPPQFPTCGCHGASASTAATAVSSPGKRPSPESKAAEEPKRRKLFLRPKEDDLSPTLQGYSKISLPLDLNPTRTRSSPVFRRSLSDTFASPPFVSSFGSGNTRAVAQETTALGSTSPSGNAPHSLPPRPPIFRRSVSDLTPAPTRTLPGSSDSIVVPDADLVKDGSPEADKMLLVIKDGVRELDQWCNKLIQYSQALSSAKQNDNPKAAQETADEPSQEECKEGVRLDRVGEAFVVEFNCPCRKSYRILFSGRDCYYKLL